MRLSILAFAFGALAACSRSGGVSLSDELEFRLLRQEFHAATTAGDFDLMRSLWAEDAVLTTADGETYVGRDAIATYLAGDPRFGEVLMLTSEGHWALAPHGGVAEYGFESIAVDVGGNDPTSTSLAFGGGQNPDVEIVGHTHSTGLALRTEGGQFVFQELHVGVGPLAQGSALTQIDPGLPVEDEVGFRRLREQFHYATTTGDRELMRSLWADDAVFRGGGNEIFGGDAITDFMAADPGFGTLLMLTQESSTKASADGQFAEYAFECIWIDVGGGDPSNTDLCAADGTQNPDVEIVNHSHTSGIAVRFPDGRWVFKEFNGAPGPLPPS